MHLGEVDDGEIPPRGDPREGRCLRGWSQDGWRAFLILLIQVSAWMVSFCFQCKYLGIFYFTENILQTADLWLFIRHLFYFLKNPDIPLLSFSLSQLSFASIDSSCLPKSLLQILMDITIFGYDKYEIKENWWEKRLKLLLCFILISEIFRWI